MTEPKGEGILSSAERTYDQAVYYVYILECKDGSLYTGITTDVKRRLAEHKSGKGGHYTRARKAVRVIYTERKKDRSNALKREAEIKGWPRQKKLQLTKSKNKNG